MKSVSNLLIVLIVTLFFTPNTLAVVPEIQWKKTFGGSSVDEGWSVQQTFDGGYIIVIVGFTKSYGAGEGDVYLIRLADVSLLKTIYVDDNSVSDPGPYDNTISDPDEDGSSAHPFDQIAEAITVAKEGAKVVVRPGTYDEAIDFIGKAITVTGLEPNRPPIVSDTIINALGYQTAVTFDSNEGPDSILSGFIIKNADTAIFCDSASPVIHNCLIVGNNATSDTGSIIMNSVSMLIYQYNLKEKNNENKSINDSNFDIHDIVDLFRHNRFHWNSLYISGTIARQ